MLEDVGDDDGVGRKTQKVVIKTRIKFLFNVSLYMKVNLKLKSFKHKKSKFEFEANSISPAKNKMMFIVIKIVCFSLSKFPFFARYLLCVSSK